MEAPSDSYELAPFDFISGWQRALSRMKRDKPKAGYEQDVSPHLREQRRRDIWNYEYNYGANASPGEKELEKARRNLYDSRHNVRPPLIPSISTAPYRNRSNPPNDPRSQSHLRQ